MLSSPASVQRCLQVAGFLYESATLSSLEEEKILGLPDLRKKAEASGKFDYDSEVEGLRALDRYTVQFRLAEPRPRWAMADRVSA